LQGIVEAGQAEITLCEATRYSEHGAWPICPQPEKIYTGVGGVAGIVEERRHGEEASETRSGRNQALTGCGRVLPAPAR
jgi:hypothetical protein